ncbi:MAG: tryptophan synthase subunit alpha [Candidatus Bathyarchaeota archaeon]|nr:tryptophan synthase subunit alpha [Candidatus Termiticorpusculum sp.]
MNKITNAFEGKKAFIAFITGGDPDIETTEKLIVAMAESGVDIIEIGIPFSDPVAEGIVIQKASERALLGGCTVDKLFEMVKSVRKETSIPLLFMTYINPVFVYGKERFMKKCVECGIDGIIVPDLPFEERDEIADECIKHGISQISLIAPTSNERIEMIAKESKGFIYCVSSLGVTGVRSEISTNISEMVKQAKKVTTTPCAIGFGISTPEQAQAMATIADGVIIGSAIVKIVEESGKQSIDKIKQFVIDVRKVLNA